MCQANGLVKSNSYVTPLICLGEVCFDNEQLFEFGVSRDKITLKISARNRIRGLYS